MKNLIALSLLLAGCSQPAVNANVGITPDGLRVYPSAHTRIGGVGVTLTP